MAEFGVQATELSAPSGAGANVVAPATAGPLDNGVGNLLGGILNIFEKGLENEAKSKAKAAERAVVDQYAKRLGSLVDASTTGGMKPSEVSARKRALHAEFTAGYSQYVDEFEKIRKSFEGGTELGEIEQEQKNAMEIQKSLESQAAQAGFPMERYFSPEARKQSTDAYQAGIRADTALKKSMEKARFDVEMGRASREEAMFKAKNDSIVILNDLATTNVDLSYTALKEFAAEARRTGDWEGAKLKWGQHLARIDMAVKGAAGIDPNLASGVGSIFSNIRTEGMALLDPSVDAKAAENKLKALVDNASYQLLIKNPDVLNFSVASKVLGVNGPLILQGVSKGVVETLGNFINPKGNAENIIGTPKDKEVFKGIQNGLDAYSRGTLIDSPEASKELVTGIQTGLRQAMQAINNPNFKPTDLVNITNMLASPSYGKFVKENPIDPQVTAMAQEVFKNFYSNQVIEGVNKKLDDTFITLVDIQSPVETRKLDINNISLNFDGSSAVFTLDKLPEDRADRQFAMKKIEELKQAQDGISKLVRLGAHMNGTTDYKAYWESNKHTLVPSLFPYPPGAVIDGFKYSGKGKWTDRNEWTRVDNGTNN